MMTVAILARFPHMRNHNQFCFSSASSTTPLLGAFAIRVRAPVVNSNNALCITQRKGNVSLTMISVLDQRSGVSPACAPASHCWASSWLASCAGIIRLGMRGQILHSEQKARRFKKTDGNKQAQTRKMWKCMS